MSVRRAGTRAVPPALTLVLALACALAPTARAADESAGTRVASFLALAPGPAVEARGGATFALGADLQSAASNPAALAGLDAGRFAFSHAGLASGATHDWAAFGGRLGAGLRWGVSGVLRDEGTLEARDALNRPLGSQPARSWALAFQLARPLARGLVAGGAMRWVAERVGESGGDGLAFDAGVQLRAGALSAGVAMQDFGGGMNWGGQRWRMPASLGAGVALEHAASGLRLLVDVAAPADYYRSVRAGAEWRWRERLALRAGYRRELGAPADERLNGPAFGLGTGVGPVWLDYALVSSPDGESVHRMGLDLRRLAASRPPVETPTAPAGAGAKAAGP